MDLFDVAPVPMCIYDAQTLRLVAVNDAARRAYGYSADELAAMRLSDLQGAFSRHRRKDGSEFEAELVTRTIVHQGRACELAVMRDVDDARRIEERLRQAERLESIGRLVGGIAHDFNNMLSVILSYTGLLIDQVPREGAMRADLDDIRRAAERAASLGHQLLAFSHEPVVEPLILDVNGVVSGMAKILGRLIGEHIELAIQLAPGLPAVLADPHDLEQVVLALALNARDAMPKGGKLTLQTGSADRFVVLSVGGPSSGRERRGGPGIASVHEIVNRLGGRVDVKTAREVGTTFEVRLPSVVPAPPYGRPPTTTRGGNSETILLVEDDDLVRGTARAILERDGYVVLDARDANDACRVSEEHADAIDLILADVVMPGTSGPELALHLASSRPEMRVLYMSGYPDGHVARLGRAMFPKPFTPELLMHEVREALDAAPE